MENTRLALEVCFIRLSCQHQQRLPVSTRSFYPVEQSRRSARETRDYTVIKKRVTKKTRVSYVCARRSLPQRLQSA